MSTGVRPKGAGGASAPPMKNNSACRNENRAIVGTGMNILSEQKLEVCWNHQKFINCKTSLELCRYIQVSKYVDIYCFNLIFVYELAISDI